MSALKSLESYGHQFQLKVVNSLLKERQFLLNIRDVIEVEHFEHIGLRFVVEEILKYFDQYHMAPNLEYFKIEVKKLENEVLQVAITEQLKSIFTIINEDREYVEQEFSEFCINQKLKQALLDSVDLLNTGQYEEIRHKIENALKAGQNKEIGHEYIKDIEKRYQENSRSPVPTPWHIINSLLQGGLGGGDYGLIYGGPGGGKSWALVAIGAFALALGYKIIHYTLELGEDYVGKRYDACFTKISVSDVGDYKEQIKEKIKGFENNLIIKEYPPKGASLSTLKAHIQKCGDMGFEADLILLDYAELLKPPIKRRDKLEEADDIHYGIKGLAKELNKPIWSVSQVNRAGAKDEVVEGDKTSGSYTKQAIVDFGMSLSRLKKDKTSGKGRGHIQKNRYGPDGMTYNMNIDTSFGGFEFLDEYDDVESFKTPQKSKNPNEVQKEEKELLLSKFKSFEIG